MVDSSTNLHRKNSIFDGPRKFYKDSFMFLNRCTKPNRREYLKILQAVSIGFAVMGFIGYFIKLVHIPINNIIVYKPSFL